MASSLPSRSRIALSLLAAALGFGLFAGTPLPARWVEVRPGWLFRSRQIPAAHVADVLRDQRIDVVIDLSDEPVDPTRDAEAAAARALGIRYLHIPVSSGAERQVSGYARAVAAMVMAHARSERVLVHCKLGYRRSAEAIALYARIVERAEPRVAYRELFRFADARADWQRDVVGYLERHLPALTARVDAELARDRALDLRTSAGGHSPSCQKSTPTESGSSSTRSGIAARSRSSWSWAWADRCCSGTTRSAKRSRAAGTG